MLETELNRLTEEAERAVLETPYLSPRRTPTR